MAELVAYRLASWDTPFWVSPNRTAARYNHAGAGPTQYLSLHPLTPWAEYLRAQGLRDAADLRDLVLRLWAVRVSVPRVEDLTFDGAAAHGLRPGDLVSDDQRACRDWADTVRLDRTAAEVWRVPSAALPGTRNLVILGPRVLAPYRVDPVDPHVDLPAAVAAERATTIGTLIPLVRYPGMRHRELEAWRRGRPFVLEEPPAPSSPAS